MQKLIISLICCLLPALSCADTLAIRDDAPDRYVVVKGDTLWDISAKFFKDPWRWPQIWGLNQEAIKNPHWIYPGDVVVLDRRGASPGVHVEPGPSEKPPEVPPPPPVIGARPDEISPQPDGEEGPHRPAGAERLSPRVRAWAGERQAIPSVPFNDIRPFLNQALVIERGELDSAPIIVSGFEGRSLLSASDIAYVKRLPSDRGTAWQIYRPGNALLDPISQKVLGYEVTYLGSARVEKFDDISTLRISSAVEDIHPGDRLVQVADEFPENFVPRAPDSDISARVMKIVNGISMAGKHAVVIINQGRRDGMQNGHVLALYRKGARVKGSPFGLKDMDMPDLRYGLLFIFRTFDHVSYGLVMQTRLPVELLDVAQTP